MKKSILVYFYTFTLLNGCGNKDLENSNQDQLWPKAGESFVTGGDNPPYNHKRFKRYRNSYYKLWKSMRITKNRSIVESHARAIAKHKSRYISVSNSLNGKIPWAFIGLTHVMEGGVRNGSPVFSKHLHNGDSLKGRTTRVPAGRPRHAPENGWKHGYTWEESAKDALILKDLHNWTGWDSIQVWGYALEGFNGFGYRGTYGGKRIGINSPYLWSFTNHYSRGKYVYDGKFSWTAVSQQAGAMAILKALMDMGHNPFSNSGGASSFNDVSPNIGKRCYAMNPFVVKSQPKVVARSQPSRDSNNVVSLLPPGSIFSPVDVSSDAKWYQMSFTYNGVTYGKNNPAWVESRQVDCNNYVGKTCRLETSFGEVISMKGGSQNGRPTETTVGTYIPNLVVNVRAVSNTKLWYFVDFTLNQKKHSGWIYRDQINCSGQQQVFSNKKLCLKPIQGGAPIKVRSEPGIDNDIPVITTLFLTAEVNSLMKVGNWFAVEFKYNDKNYGVRNGVQAYIYAGQTRPCQ